MKGVSDNTNVCYFYSLSLGPFAVEIACYSGTTNKQIQVATIDALAEGSYRYQGGAIGWLFQPDGSYDISWVPATGTPLEWTGTFK